MAWLREGLEERPSQKTLATVVPLDFLPLIATMSQTKVPGKKAGGVVLGASMAVEVPFFCGFAKVSSYWTTFSISIVRIVARAVCAQAFDLTPAVTPMHPTTTFRQT